jgi:hypothetical protein
VADDAPIWDAYSSGGSKPRLAVSNVGPVPLVLRSARLPPPTQIPPRQWLYGTQLLRGFVTVLVAPGGTGKSAYAMAVAAALASGKPFLGEHIFASVRTAVLNLEDPMDELDRRLAAIMLRHKLDRDDLDGRMFLHSGEDRQLTMATLSDDGFTVIHPDEEPLIEQIRANDLGLVIADPYAESHTLEENSNPQMIQAAAAWRRVARATNCAVMLVHHVRKGAVTDMDASRGAKGLTDSARVGLLLSPMTEDDSRSLGIGDDERWRYVRLDDGKANMAPRATKARWLKLDQLQLNNETSDYPNGDRVAAVTAWEPPDLMKTADVHLLNAALDIIATPPAGWLYMPDPRSAATSRWAGGPIMDKLDCTEKQAQKFVEAWLRSGLLYKESFHDKAARKERHGVRVDDTRRPS